jgi:S1-C subfamily serine protease
VDKESRWFKIDTGMSGQGSGSLDGPTYRLLEKTGHLLPAGHSFSLTASGTRKNSLGRLGQLRIGTLEHTNLYFSPTEQEGFNLLGLGFWARYQVTFDFPGQAIHLRKGARHTTPGVVDGSGVTMLLRKGRAIVEVVAERSPAAKVGIHKGDEIVSVAGRKAAGANLFVLRRRLYGEGRTVRLQIRRGDNTREVPLRLDLAWRTDKTDR